MARKPPAAISSTSRVLRSAVSAKQTGTGRKELAASSDETLRDQGSGALKGFVATSSPTAIEDNTHVILGNGLYQIRLLVASALATAMIVTQALAYELIGRPVEHWCRPPADLRDMSANVWRNAAIPVDVDGHFSQCTMYDPPIAENDTEVRVVVECREWDYDGDRRADSVISRWDLVCGRRWLYELSAIVAMLAGGGIRSGFRCPVRLPGTSACHPHRGRVSYSVPA
ncbi:hypothetical protein MTO96_026875 [Rhipicephalus appendiculatus]